MIALSTAAEQLIEWGQEWSYDLATHRTLITLTRVALVDSVSKNWRKCAVWENGREKKDL